jgi:serine/threonine-protein kinase
MRSGTTPPRFPPARTPEEAYFQHVLEQAMARRADARPPTARHLELAMRTIADGIRPKLPTSRIGGHAISLGATKLVLEVGDIADVECDAIVTSGYDDMKMRTGAGDALRRRGGDSIEEEAMRGGPRALGDCVATGAGSLRCKQVLHAVAAWREVSCIARSTWRALFMAEAAGHTRIAMPAIGTGQGRVSMASCADTIAAVLRLHLALGGSKLSEVRVVLRDEQARNTFAEVATGLVFGSERKTDDHDVASAPEDWSAPTLFASEPKRRLSERPPR